MSPLSYWWHRQLPSKTVQNYVLLGTPAQLRLPNSTNLKNKTKHTPPPPISFTFRSLEMLSFPLSLPTVTYASVIFRFIHYIWLYLKLYMTMIHNLEKLDTQPSLWLTFNIRPYHSDNLGLSSKTQFTANISLNLGSTILKQARNLILVPSGIRLQSINQATTCALQKQSQSERYGLKRRLEHSLKRTTL